MSENSDNLMNMVTDIVSAHVSNNNVAIGDVANLVQTVHSALVGLGLESLTTGPVRREPVVSIRSSVKPEAITCLVCGAKNKMLKRHLQTAHDLTPAEYRSVFGLKNDYPMVAPDYAQARSELAKKIGLGSTANRGARKTGGPKAKGSRGAQ